MYIKTSIINFTIFEAATTLSSQLLPTMVIFSVCVQCRLYKLIMDPQRKDCHCKVCDYTISREILLNSSI